MNYKVKGYKWHTENKSFSVVTLTESFSWAIACNDAMSFDSPLSASLYLSDHWSQFPTLGSNCWIEGPRGAHYYITNGQYIR